MCNKDGIEEVKMIKIIFLQVDPFRQLIQTRAPPRTFEQNLPISVILLDSRQDLIKNLLNIVPGQRTARSI